MSWPETALMLGLFAFVVFVVWGANGDGPGDT